MKEKEEEAENGIEMETTAKKKISEEELSKIQSIIYKELTSKIFNARITVFFKAYTQEHLAQSSKEANRPTMRSVANNENAT